MAAAAPSPAALAARDRQLDRVLALWGADVPERVRSARVLVVGAGGIGCELLKNLALTGFRRIHVVDLDTIDVSNLNRQFLFRREHVGLSKAEVARESVLRYDPRVEITARHGNIKDASLGAAFYAQFDLVLNALDNLDARRHVNRVCYATKTLLVESGTQGYIGQVKPIRPTVTECFECQPQSAAKTYAVCTIRSTPDKPVHCIVWAKCVYAAVFGPRDEENMLSDLAFDPAGSAGAPDKARAFARAVYDQLFVADIEASLRVKERWSQRDPPRPLPRDALGDAAPPAGETATQRQHRALGDAENAAEFLAVVEEILTARAKELGDLVFDKDDALAMRFVASAANLRASSFGIPVQTAFQAKGIAGNIVHAIATTNAICAGVIVSEALKLLAGRGDDCRLTWIKRAGPKVLQPQRLDPPNKECYVCGKSQLRLTVDASRFTLRQLYDAVLTRRVGMTEPSIDVMNRDNYVGIREEQDDAYLARALDDAALKMGDGAILAVEDDQQEFRFNMIVRHDAGLDEEKHPEGFVLDGTAAAEEAPAEEEAAPAPAAEAPAPPSSLGGAADGVIELDDSSDDDIVAVAPAPKRRAGDADGDGSRRKRARRA